MNLINFDGNIVEIETEDGMHSLVGDSSLNPQCLWTLTDFSENLWETSCGSVFFLIEYTPKENGMQYCCYCGKALAEEIKDFMASLLNQAVLHGQMSNEEANKQLEKYQPHPQFLFASLDNAGLLN